MVRQPAHELLLTQRSEGSSHVVAAGALVVVRLSGGDLRWSGVTVVQSAGVLVRQAGTVLPGGSATAAFRATDAGRSTVEATARPNCPAHVPCPQYVLLWRATVTVPAGSSASDANAATDGSFAGRVG